VYSVGPVTLGTITTMIFLRGETYMYEGGGRWIETEIEVSDQETTHANFDFDGSYDASIEGVVTVNGVPAKSSAVRVSATLGNGDRAIVQVFCLDDGSYRMDGVPAGSLEGETRPNSADGEYLGIFDFNVVTRSGETTQYDINIEL
jgi:hypothetical protein